MGQNQALLSTTAYKILLLLLAPANIADLVTPRFDTLFRSTRSSGGFESRERLCELSQTYDVVAMIGTNDQSCCLKQNVYVHPPIPQMDE